MLITRHNPSNAILIIGSIAVTSNTIDSDSIHTNIIHECHDNNQSHNHQSHRDIFSSRDTIVRQQ